MQISRIRIEAGKKKISKKYAARYRKIFTKRNAGRKVKVTL